jgi:LuxR family transcriptional regulator, maltose regulon positive regulatory protein
VVCSSFADMLYEWNRLEEAEHHVTEALELGQRLAFGSALWSAYYTLARIRLTRGDRKGAEMAIVNQYRYRLVNTVPVPIRLMDAEQARANLMLGNLETVQRWEATIQTNKPRVLDFIQEVEDMTLARFYLLRGQPDLALHLLDSFRSTTETSGRKGHLIEILALTALGQQALGRNQEAIETLGKALQMAKPEGYLRTFTDTGQPMAALLYKALAQGVMPDYVRRLLSIFAVDDTTSSSFPDPSELPLAVSVEQELIEPLSERELEVLQLMASGASNQEIAETLVIALTTAKKHVSNIIGKLGADNRTQAVAKGRNLDLCE